MSFFISKTCYKVYMNSGSCGVIKFKAFIYRFSNIFGLRIYLANKEEQAYIDSLDNIDSEVGESCYRGLWQAKRGFTTVWTYKQPFFQALITKIKHAFDFKRLDL